MRVWSPAAGTLEVVVTQQSIVWRLAISPDGTLLASVGGYTIYLWDMATRKLRAALKHRNTVSGAAFTPDGRRVVTSGWDRNVRIWDAVDGRELFTFDLRLGRITALAVAPDGMTFAAACQNRRQIVVMDVPD